MRVWDAPVRLLHWGQVADVGGMLWTSRQHRENLVRAMLTGDKAPPAGGDVA
ncbi:MAG TPA: hypothetical protein PK925_13645 [Alicycliphilus sp.]|jgi:cytochrome b|nr:hypothetical protein [Alicycliphilus sp.]